MAGSEACLSERLAGKQILVTSGPTRAYLDRVRYLSNTSTGELGARLAQELSGAGARVLFVYGSGSRRAEGPGINPREVRDVKELETILREVIRKHQIDAVVHAMAVLDYIPAETIQGKKPSGCEPFAVTLVPAPKVISVIRSLVPHACFISFKLEAGVDDETLRSRAYASLTRWGTNYVVANDIDRLTPDRHPAVVIDASGAIIARCMTKHEISVTIASLLVQELSG